MKFVNLIVFLVFILLIGFPLVTSFQGNSLNYDLEVNFDSFSSNASSSNMVQRLIGGSKAVSSYLSSSYSGRWGILNVTCNGDYGSWSAWSSCVSSSQSRTRTDSSGCVQTESQSCTGSSGPGPSGCTSKWTEWTEWSDCVDGNQTRTREDGCSHEEEEFRDCTVSELEICDDGIDNDLDSFVDCEDIDCEDDSYCISICESDWDCSWNDCELVGDTYFSSPYGCVDLNECEDSEIPEDVECSIDPETGEPILPDYDGGCRAKWNCSDWSICNPDYDLKNILKGDVSVEGVQWMSCSDLRDCRKDKVDFKNCSLAIPVEAKRTTWCFEEYVEIYEIGSGVLVSRIKETSVKEVNQLDVGFLVSNFQGYCDYCYDGIKNYDETDLDCGGPSCPQCIDKGNYFDWLYFVKLALWILLFILVIFFIAKNKGTIWITLTSPEVVSSIGKSISSKIRYRKLIFNKPINKGPPRVNVGGIKNKILDWKGKGYNTVALEKQIDTVQGKKPRVSKKFNEYT